jgi:peptide/nickel transport system substrate-binding protein
MRTRRLVGAAALSRAIGLAAIVTLLAAVGASTAEAAKTAHLEPTVTWAEYPADPPTYIFPMTSGAYTLVANSLELSTMIWLPLYWFGSAKGSPNVNYQLSLANAPVFSDSNTLINITLRHYRWSNGDPVTARDVIFWMNLVSAVSDPKAPVIGSTSSPGPGWGEAVPGGFPENIVSYRQTGTYSLTIKLNASYDPSWYLYNELSQIHPIPQQAWDKLSDSGAVGNYDTAAQARTPLAGTSPAQYVPVDPGTATSGPLGVAQFLNLQSQNVSTYDTNPLWQVVDGSFRLKQFTQDGFVKLVPNKEYSGSPKPKIAAFEEFPFPTDVSEFNSVLSGTIDYGSIPLSDFGQLPSLKKKGYIPSPWYGEVADFLNYNYTNPTTGPILKQLYFRQAIQSLINQPEEIKDFLEGDASLNNGPVPSTPLTKWDSRLVASRKSYYPYSAAKAVAYLKDNGWAVEPGGDSYCARPGTGSGECGAGVKAHAQVTFKLLYPSGLSQYTNMFASLQSILKQKLGIDISPTSATFGVIGSEMFGCDAANPCSSWSMGFYDGWFYSYYPTGDQLFYCNAPDNAGDYCNAQDDANITATTKAPSLSAEYNALYKYENYLAKQLPVAWIPNTPNGVSVIRKTLKGAIPQGVFTELYPQYYSWSK